MVTSTIDPISKTVCGRLRSSAHTLLLGRCQAPYQPAVALTLHSSLSGHTHNRVRRSQSAACLTWQKINYTEAALAHSSPRMNKHLRVCPAALPSESSSGQKPCPFWWTRAFLSPYRRGCTLTSPLAPLLPTILLPPPPSPYTAHEMVEQSLLPPFPNPARQGPSPGPLSTGSGDKRQLPVAPHVPVPPPPPGRLPERGLARPTPWLSPSAPPAFPPPPHLRQPLALGQPLVHSRAVIHLHFHDTAIGPLRAALRHLPGSAPFRVPPRTHTGSQPGPARRHGRGSPAEGPPPPPCPALRQTGACRSHLSPPQDPGRGGAGGEVPALRGAAAAGASRPAGVPGGSSRRFAPAWLSRSRVLGWGNPPTGT